MAALTADKIELRTWLTNYGSSGNQVSDSIIQQGLTSIADLYQMDPDDIETICNSACKP